VAEAELNLRIVAPLLAYVRERRGAAAMQEIAAAAEVSAEVLGAEDAWVSHEAFERVLSAARERVASNEEFADACAHGLAEKKGPLRTLVGAVGPRDAYELGARHLRVLSHVSRIEVQSAKDGSVTLRYTSEKPESRLMCLSRLGQIANLPQIWGLPKAHVEEKRCIASGDDCCEYRVCSYERSRWSPAVLGLVAGVAGGAALGSLELGGVALAVAAALAGAGVGHLIELRRATRMNSLVAREINQAYLSSLEAEAEAEAEARREILALTARQHEWIRRLEERRDESSAVEQLARGIEAVREQWIGAIRGFSHDLRSPLTVVKTNVGYLRDSGAVVDDEGGAVLDDIDAGVQQIEKLLNALLSVATFDISSVRLEPETVDTTSLAERIRARAVALLRGRPVRVSVTRAREAPPSIECDRLLLDRVLDNLLSNAANYTERGYVAVEVGGTPGYLTLKISDTGRGIEDVELERIFQPGARRARKGDDSWGVGLSVVVQLLSRVGGRLEVMSKPGEGTTFWAHLPVNAPKPAAADAERPSNVVSIRRAKSA